jgi:hypothetical protein
MCITTMDACVLLWDTEDIWLLCVGAIGMAITMVSSIRESLTRLPRLAFDQWKVRHHAACAGGHVNRQEDTECGKQAVNCI